MINPSTLQLGKGKKATRAKKRQLEEEDVWHRSYFEPGPHHPHALDGSSSWIGYELKKDKKMKNQKHDELQKKGMQMRKWLESQTTYALHRPAAKSYPRRQFVVDDIDTQWQADLSDLTWHKNVNRGYGWMMVVIDVLSRYLWIEPLKTKSGEETTRGYKAVINRAVDVGHRPPLYLYVDKGKEFYNRNFKEYLNSFTPPTVLISGHDGTTKAAIAERVQLTIKRKLWKLFYETGSYNWVDSIQSIVDAYNNRRHGSIKRPPNSVTREDADDIKKTLYGSRQSYLERFHESDYKFNVGDVVRISKQKQLFRKGYLPQWTEEWFKIAARDPGPPPYYRLEEYKEGGDRVEGTFYEPELQQVTEREQKEGLFRIEHIIKRRTVTKGRRKVKEVLVKFQGWPDQYNHWIEEEGVTPLKS